MTTFGGTQLSEDGAKQLFGDLTETTEIDPSVEPETTEQTPAPEPAAEPADAGQEPEETPQGEGTEPASGEATEPTEVSTEASGADWKKRYDDLRTTNMQLAQQERERAEQAEKLLSQLIESQSSAKIAPEKIAELVQRAEELGMDPAQIGLYADLTSEAVDVRSALLAQGLQQQASDASAAAAARQQVIERELVDGFIASHQITESQRPQMARFLYDVGAAYFVDEAGNELPAEMDYESKQNLGHLTSVQPIDNDILDVAYKAVSDPNLGTVLRAMPSLYESDEGMQMAERLASQMTPVAITQAPRPQVDAALAAAETLGGPSAPAVEQQEPIFSTGRPKDVFFSR